MHPIASDLYGQGDIGLLLVFSMLVDQQNVCWSLRR